MHTKPKTSCQDRGQWRQLCTWQAKGRSDEGGGTGKGEATLGVREKAVDRGLGRRSRDRAEAPSVGTRGTSWGDSECSGHGKI